MITPEMTELIRQQRLNYLIEGSKFPKYTTRGRMKGNYSNWVFLSNNPWLFYFKGCILLVELSI